MKENDNNSLAETLVNYEMLIEMILELGEVEIGRASCRERVCVPV